MRESEAFEHCERCVGLEEVCIEEACEEENMHSAWAEGKSPVAGYTGNAYRLWEP